MYAVIESGGKQYRVELGSEIQVDRLDVQPGDNITLERVLLVADDDATAVGRPVVEGAIVSAEVLRQERGDKIVVFKYKPKARTRVKKGARAELTTLRIADIAIGGKSAAKAAEVSESKKAKAASEAEKAAAEKAAADQALAAKLAAAGEASAVAAEAPAPQAKPAPRKSPATAQSAPEVEVAAEPVESTLDTEPATQAEIAAEPEAEADTRKDD